MNSTNFSLEFPLSTEEITAAELDINLVYEKYIPEKFVIPKVLKTILYVFGFPGNILACILWLQKPMLHSSGCYLAALAVSDVIFLIMSLMYDLTLYWKMKILDFPTICQLFPCLYLSVQYLSPLLTLAFTVERFISIRFPFKRRIYCNIKRAVCVILTLVALSLGVAGIQIYFWHYDYHSETCVNKFELVYLSEKWTWITECVMFMFVPVVILLFNILLVVTMRNSSRRAQELYGPMPPKQRTATTKMLLVVSFVLIFTTIPVSIAYSLNEKFPAGDSNSINNIADDVTWQRHLNFVLTQEIIYDLGLVHYACNFYLYLLTGKRFRLAIKKYFQKLSVLKLVDFKDRNSRSLRSSFTELRSLSWSIFSKDAKEMKTEHKHDYCKHINFNTLAVHWFPIYMSFKRIFQHIFMDFTHKTRKNTEHRVIYRIKEREMML